MSDGKVIEFADVSMVFGDAPAVDGLTARVDPGRVTAFLGPNGAGKTTTLRILLGELRPTWGRATIGGTEYARIARPAASIGAVMSLETLERARRKTASKHLAKSAKRVGVGSARVREVLTIVGLAEMAEMRIGNLSLGMKHRLAVAEALLGNPSVLVFDEPANGLDPEGIRWIRLLMRKFADEGRTVLMSSHVLSEVEQVADSLLVLNQGELLFEGPIELLSEAEGGVVTVDADDRDALRDALDEAGFEYRVLRSGIAIDDATTSEVGSLAAAAGIALSTLTHRGPTLEDVYLQIIDGTWSAPARTAALDPAAFAGVSDDDDEQGVEEGGAGSDAADARVDDDAALPSAAADANAPRADDAVAEENPEPSDDGASEHAEAPDSDADELEAMFSDDEPADGGATAALPGVSGLAGLAHGLRSDDEDGDGEEVPEGVVSPGVERTLSGSDAEAAADSADDDWEAQLLSSMLDEEPDEKKPQPDASGAFPAASFDVSD